ncbi:MAG TPA: UPF0182 family protein [Acetobacteraceae bacterium]|nr:UPF0182 family protein [Acetobacteraceae bacterium]
MRSRRVGVAIAVIVGCLVVLARASSLVVDWAWFSEVGYAGVFWTVFATKIVLFISVFAVSSLLFWVNGALALRFAWRRFRLSAAFDPDRTGVPALPGTPAELFGLASSLLPWRLLVLGVALAGGVAVAIGETGQWDLILRFIYQVPYGQHDPLFGKDIGFYLFSLPAYIALKNWMLTVLALSSVMAGAVYFVHGDINPDRWPWRVSAAAIAHGSALLGLYFAVKAWSYVLDRYLLLYNDNGVVIGAGYTDVHVVLPVLWLLAGIAAVAAVIAWVNLRRRIYRPAVAASVLVFGGSFVLAEVVPGLFERFYVKPSELQLEAPYIRRNIALTREAYNLRKIVVKPFPAEQGLTFQSLQDNHGTVNNIRLWDWQPLMDTYAQLQEIRTYYKFLDVDVDRYHIGGSYQQVTIAARELAPSLLSANAQTWVNLHLLFTHGNGVVMSPVTQKSTEGLPNFYLRDIPPVGFGGAPAVTQPRIYFGQGTDGYVIVKGSTPEFDYPKGSDNVYTTYDGADGVAIGGLAWRTLFAWYFDDVNILLSRYITGASKILFHRNIQDRVRTIAPFLQLDRDPYIVVSGGRLYWIQDAYTTSDWFPYAQPLPHGDTNYIRNSVKVVIDAYNGTATFYVADPADPIIATYRRIFPGLFKPLAAMPPDLLKHIRYPEDLFDIQAQQYLAYHMDTPEVFYNREDLWQFPREPAAPDGNGTNTARMTPYYIMMRLPGESHTEFFLMLPMVPSQRENMIAWLAARCDPHEYGKLIVYEFPKDKLVYGPFQIDARINQNTEISQQISLWNQMGSRVIRGNLLVVPIDNSILYVSPLYLRAESGQLPELKRVIAAYGDRVVMEKTLPEALAALFRQTAPVAALPASAGPVSAGPADARARAALDHYNLALERLKAGDWAGFGAELDALRPLLEQLGGQPAAH